MFKVGDWVQITPTPDLGWSYWYNSQDIYDKFLDKVGVVEFVADDDERPGEFLFAIKVHFPYGFGDSPPGNYHEWFREGHLIRSTKSQATLRTNMEKAGKELQEWEKFKRESTDRMLRQVFVKEPEKPKKQDMIYGPGTIDGWEEETVEIDRDHYDNEQYIDYSSQMYQYINDPDVDYSYPIDFSNVQKKDKD